MENKLTPIVSVIIPCYNLGKYLEDAVMSVMDQSYKDWELIIVDDGSNDTESHRAISLIKQKYPEVKVLMQNNQGQSIARNNGIKMSTGKYIVCLDADDKLSRTFLARCVRVMDKKSRKVAIVSTWVQEFGLRNGVWKTEDFSVPKVLITNILHAGSMFRKNVWEEVGGYKKDKISGYEDWELWLSVVEAGYTWEIIAEPLFNYRIRPNSMLSTAVSNHAIKYRRIYELHPKLFMDYNKEFALETSTQLKELHNTIGYKQELLSKTTAELNLMKAKIAKIEEDTFELERLHKSRVTKPAIIARKHLINIRRKIRDSK